MTNEISDPYRTSLVAGTVPVIMEDRRQQVLLKTGALQNAIFNSANFSGIATATPACKPRP